MQPKYFITCLLTVLLSATFSSAASASALHDDDSKLRAVYLFNFTRFIEWSDAHFADANTPVAICLSKQTPALTSKMRDLIKGRKIGRYQRSIVLHTIGTKAADNQHCHLSYLSNTEDALALQSNQGLKIGHNPSFAEYGTAINFFYEGQRLRFEILPSRLQRMGMTLSPELLKLAQITKE